METNAIDNDFQATIQRIGLLSGSEENMETFIEAYRQAIEDTYNSMMQVRNIDELLEGVYRQRAEMLKAMLQRQIDHFGLEWPDTTIKPASSGRA
jgi:endonuclease III